MLNQDNLNHKKILIVRLSSIGDCIHTLPAVNAIKEAFPLVKISWLIEKENSFLVENNTIIDKVHIFNKKLYKKSALSGKTISELTHLIKEIRKEEYDIAIDFQGLMKSGILTWLSNAKRTIGFKNTREFADLFVKEKINIGNIFDESEHVIEKNIKVAQYLGIKNTKIIFKLPQTSQETKNKITNLLKDADEKKQIIGIIPGTLWKNKYWNTAYWIELLKQIEDNYNIIFIGTEKDQNLINTIKSQLNQTNYIDLCSKTTLIELIELFNYTNIIIGVDTGPVHLAVATNYPKVIALFGPSSSIRNGAFRHINLSTKRYCQPCFKKKCLNIDKSKNLCMKELTPTIVLDQINLLKYKKETK